MTSVILSSSIIQNGCILVPANPGPPGKMAVKMERENLKFVVHHQGTALVKVLNLFMPGKPKFDSYIGY